MPHDESRTRSGGVAMHQRSDRPRHGVAAGNPPSANTPHEQGRAHRVKSPRDRTNGAGFGYQRIAQKGLTTVRLRIFTTVALALLGLTTMSACEDSSAFQPAPVPGLTCPPKPGAGPVTLVVGARANSPIPVLPQQIIGLLREAAKQGQTISLVLIDGAPKVTYQGAFKTEAGNDIARRSALDIFLTRTVGRLGLLAPEKPEADVFAALKEAADITPAGGTVVLLGSGLQAAGQLRLQDEGMFGVYPQEVVDYLKIRSRLPNLTGRDVLLVGLGNTANPQGVLDSNLRGKVIELWQ